MGDRLLLLALFLSGAAALGYEILWTRLLGLALGSESLGVLGVLAGFFGGLALGSWLLHRHARYGRDPLRLFVLLELVAASYALISPYFLHWLALRVPSWLGSAAGDNDTAMALVLALGLATLTLLPATAPMGATLAALTEARRRRLGDDAARGSGRLYAANTLGATAGVLGTVYLLLPRSGLAWGALWLAGLGFVAATSAWVWGRSRRRPARIGAEAISEGVASSLPSPERWIYGVLLLTGLAGVGLEVAVVQILAQVLEDTVYTFAGVLAMYLLGTALGAWIWARVSPGLEQHSNRWVTVALLLVQALTVVLCQWLLAAVPAVLELAAPDGSGYGRRLGSELLVSAMVLVLPTLVMGALFSQLVGRCVGRGVGRAYALNTLGGMLAPFLFGLWVLRYLGYAPTLALACSLYLATALVLTYLPSSEPGEQQGSMGRAPAWAAALAVLLCLAVSPRPMVLIGVEAGFRPVAFQPSLYGAVLVSEEVASLSPGANLHRRLQVNRSFRMGGSLSFGEQRMGHIPLLLQPEARRVLFLGVGTGATLGATVHASLDRVDAVELVPEVVQLLDLFSHVNEGVLERPELHLHAADARRFVAASRQHYNLVVGDLFHPARDGAGSLYSLEHFQAVRQRLATGGLYIQWLPLYQLDESNLKTVIRTFLEVFPAVHSFLGLYNAETPCLALIGSEQSPSLELSALRRRLEAPIYQQLQLASVPELLASYILDRGAMLSYAGPGPLNTDLNPRLLFDAPRSAYMQRPDLAWGALASLLAHRTPFPANLLRGEADELQALQREVAALADAIGHYLRADIARLAGGGRWPPKDEVVELYWQAFDVAPHFAPARHLLHMAARARPDGGLELWQRMLQRLPEDRDLHLRFVSHLQERGEEQQLAVALEQGRERFGADFARLPSH